MKTQSELIGGYEFDLNQKVFLHHPNNKFWEVEVSGKSVTYRVGKLSKSGEETNVEEVAKDYNNNKEARETAKTKILDKLTKGYFSKAAIKKQQSQKQKSQNTKQQQKSQSTKYNQQPKDNQQPTIKINSLPANKKNDSYSGEYYQKDTQATKLQVSDNRVKLTRITLNEHGGVAKEGYEIRHLDSNQKAIQFCLEQEAWYISENYKPNHRKFAYTFVDDQDNTKSKKTESKTTIKKQLSEPSTKKTNLLSITQMTDDAMSHRSRATSSFKSDRSYHDDGKDQPQLKSSKLGPPTSSCINVLLAQTWSDQSDPTGWIMSEKLDGVRCFWTGTAMYSRNGNRFYPPKWFVQNWPKSQLDGQLFIGRGQFSKTISAVKKNNPIDSEWQNVRYLVFDAPGLKQKFNKRIQMIKQVIESLDNNYIKCHSHRVCSGYTDLFEELERVNKIEGEGLMLRDPASVYENKRSKSLLKVKTFHDDEAVVLGYKPGTGRCQGMVGALKCKNTHGVDFEVGSGLTDDMRRKPPKIGSKITYKYQEFNKDSGKPRFPTFLRVFEEKI